MIKFQGLVGSTFGGFTTIRGTARFSDIVALSEAKDYQRETIPKHLAEISNYYEEQSNLFFPEVILSLELKYDFTLDDSISGMTPLQNIIGGNDFKSNVNAVEIKLLAKRHQNDKLRVANFILRNSTEKVFGRIDGNHRLSAENNQNILNEEIPFCIVLFESENISRQEKMLFFNINSKSIPLTTEETLKSIFNDDTNFNDELLKANSSFGWEYYFTKQIIENEVNGYFINISTLFNNNFSTTFLKLFKLLLTNEVLQKEDTQIELVKSALSHIDAHIYHKSVLKNSNNTSVFSAFLYYQLKSPELINFIENWILKNEIYLIEELEPDSIIKIIDNIANHKVIKIFVAMPYFSHTTVQSYNNLFKEVLLEIQEKLNTPYTLELMPIMRYRGASERIDIRLLNEIRICDIFIADLTGANKNVLYETGFAEGLEKPSILIKEENDIEELPFDASQRQYIPYIKDDYINKIKSIIKINLSEILKR